MHERDDAFAAAIEIDAHAQYTIISPPLGNSGKINGGLWANSTMTAGTTCCRFMVARALILLASQSL